MKPSEPGLYCFVLFCLDIKILNLEFNFVIGRSIFGFSVSSEVHFYNLESPLKSPLVWWKLQTLPKCTLMSLECRQ